MQVDQNENKVVVPSAQGGHSIAQVPSGHSIDSKDRKDVKLAFNVKNDAGLFQLPLLSKEFYGAADFGKTVDTVSVDRGTRAFQRAERGLKCTTKKTEMAKHNRDMRILDQQHAARQLALANAKVKAMEQQQEKHLAALAPFLDGLDVIDAEVKTSNSKLYETKSYLIRQPPAVPSPVQPQQLQQHQPSNQQQQQPAAGAGVAEQKAAVEQKDTGDSKREALVKMWTEAQNAWYTMEGVQDKAGNFAQQFPVDGKAATNHLCKYCSTDDNKTHGRLVATFCDHTVHSICLSLATKFAWAQQQTVSCPECHLPLLPKNRSTGGSPQAMTDVSDR